MSELTDLYAQIRTCTRCLLSQSRTRAVPGEGPEDAAVMFIGEAPGFHEDKTGRPLGICHRVISLTRRSISSLVLVSVTQKR